MGASLTTLPLFFEFDSGSDLSRSEGAKMGLRASGRRRSVLAACLLLSLVLHGLGVWMADFRPVHHLILDTLVILDIAAVRPPPFPGPDGPVARDALSSVSAPPEPASLPQAAQTQAPKVAMPKKERPATAIQPKSVAKETPLPKPGTTPPVPAPADVESEVAVGQIVQRQGVTVLANESGMDSLKHGSEARFMHGVATEEFVEENYVGEYVMGKLGKVWIEDDRARSGHLILHAEHMGFRRPLFRFNRFIYVYGEKLDSPEPILGSVTFFSDGYHIHQFMWQHNSTYAYFPRRN